MADDKIRLQIITAGGVKFDKMVSYVGVPLQDGSIGVLPGHAPLLAAVADGPVKCTCGGQDEFVYVGSGVVDVMNDSVSLLVRAAESAETIDLARAQAAEKRAQERIESHSADVDMMRAEASLRRALARERTYDLFKND